VLDSEGVQCADRLGHFKKKFLLTKNLLLVLRQDLPKMNFGVVPSPEIQLEHEVCTTFEVVEVFSLYT
jgi:hypothetical protein